MELKIQYARRADGAKTALGTMGEGSPLVMPPGFSSHLDWWGNDPKGNAFCQRLAEHHTVVLYDRHGFGLSDRERVDYSLEDDLLDLDAVVEALSIEKFALFGGSMGGLFAIGYTSRCPERVSHLVLYGTGAGYTPGQYAEREAVAEALRKLKHADWDLYCKTMARVFFPSGADLETLESLSYFEKIAGNPELEDRLNKQLPDLRPLLPNITQPALVIHRRGDQVVPFEAGQELAMLLPNATFLPMEGDIHPPGWGDTDAVVRAIEDFLGDSEPASDRPQQPAAATRGGPVTILFTDMESSTANRQQLGDAKAQEALRTHNRIVREALAANGGSEIKHTGDGIMASFGSASSALNCAIAIQRGVAAHKEEQPDSPLAVYIGLNAGEPISEEDDLFGTSVDLAARICGEAEPSEILVSDVVRQLAAGKEFLFSNRGESALRGFEDPVKLWELRWREGG